VRASYMT